MKIDFEIDGEPQGKARPRHNGYVTYTPEKTRAYENLVRMAYKAKYSDMIIPAGTGVKMRIIAYFGIPESDTKAKRKLKGINVIRPTKKPDWDNIGKIIADSLNGIAYYDDSQIVEATVEKYYGAPRVHVYIEKAKAPAPLSLKEETGSGSGH